MKKILFDSSIHLGQFCTNNESLRLACKNSQVSLSTKPKKETIGVISFDENSWSDDIIWQLERKTQDIFYKFMDVFHSVKNIDRIALSVKDAELALKIAKKTKLNMANSLSCAVAITKKVNEIHTVYPSLLASDIKTFMQEGYNITILKPEAIHELLYTEEGLEKQYQEALAVFKKESIDLTKLAHA